MLELLQVQIVCSVHPAPTTNTKARRGSLRAPSALQEVGERRARLNLEMIALPVPRALTNRLLAKPTGLSASSVSRACTIPLLEWLLALHAHQGLSQQISSRILAHSVQQGSGHSRQDLGTALTVHLAMGASVAWEAPHFALLWSL